MEINQVKGTKAFHIIKQAGEPVSARTLDGKYIERRGQVWIPEYSRFVVLAPYDNHFIYESKKKDSPSFMCTCGSYAVIVGSNAYKKDASPTSGGGIMPGELMVCYYHANNGKHADGSSQWIILKLPYL